LSTRRLLLGPTLALVSATVYGADETTLPAQQEEKPTELEAVTVTASPLGQEELHIAQPVTVLRGDDLQRKQALTIGETLTQELGVSATGFGLGASRPIIRGLGGSRVRILEGGIGSMDVSNLSDDHAVSIDPMQASQIEILKGPSTLLYGSGAIGGVVNIVNNRIPTFVPDRPTGQAAFRYDAATNELAGGASVDAGIGNFAAHLDGLKRSTSDYDIPGFGSLDPGPGERRGVLANSDIDTDNIAGGASYSGDRGYLGFSLGHFATNYGIPGDGVRIDLDQTRYDIAGELYDPTAGFSKLRLRLGHNDYTHQELDPSGAVGTTFLNDEYEGRIELTHNPLWDFRGVVGVQIQHRDFSALGAEQLTPAVQGRSVGVFAVEERDWNRWHFEVGARFENTHYDPDGNNPVADHTVYSLSGGTVWKLIDGYSAGLSLTRAQRAPSIEELYNHGPHDATNSFEVGNPNLREESANNLDLTFRKLEGRWTWRFNVFANYIQDFIFGSSVDQNQDGQADRVDDEGDLVLDNDGMLLIDFIQKDAIFYGTEFETTLGLLRNKPYGELDARLFTDYVRGRLTNGDNLPRITPLRFGGGLDYHFGPWKGDFEVRRVQRQEDSAPLESETAGYTLVNADVSYTLGSKKAEYVLSLRGTNLLDEDVRYHTSFLKDVAPQPGRSVLVGLQVNF
jgi:iron complex outermembrane recepter protein